MTWQRLSVRMIWVDLIQSLLAISPGIIAFIFFDVEEGTAFWSLLLPAILGVGGAVSDAWRWLFTRYRITTIHLEIITGLFLKTHRSVRRERIRSVDIEARLRHRLSGLRLVKIGAGQQNITGEAALDLNAVTR